MLLISNPVNRELISACSGPESACLILTAIYEQDFLRCSYGYRPNKGALDAVDKLTIKLQFGRYHRIVEADIRGFFNNISHERMVRMLAERIDDRAADASITEEPGAGKSHAGICAGAVG